VAREQVKKTETSTVTEESESPGREDQDAET
jgi:hypothetical protein